VASRPALTAWCGEPATERRDNGAGAARQTGDGAAGGAVIGDGSSTLTWMGVGHRATSDAVTVSIFTSIG